MPIRGKKMADVKQGNRRAILKLLHEEGEMSRKKLAARLSLTPAAITLIVADMIEEGLLCEGEAIVQSGMAGRREINLSIQTERFVALGVAININEYTLSAITLSGRVVATRDIEPLSSNDAQTVVAYVCEHLKAFLQTDVPKDAQIVGLGVALRGIVDSVNGVSIDTLGLWLQKNANIQAMFAKKIPWPVYLDNNMRAIARAQMFIVSEPANANMVFVRSSYGIGAALTIDYKILEGMHHRAAEIGHMCVEPNGRPCICGERGCLETVASYHAIMTDAREALSERDTPALYRLCGGCADAITFDMIDQAQAQGDEPICAIWERAIVLTSQALQMLIRVADIDKIVLYGKLFENQRYFDEISKRTYSCLPFDFRDCIVEKSAVNLMLDQIAPAVLAVHAFFDRGGMLT